MRYSFTGPSQISQEQEEFVRDQIERLNPAPTEMTTGAAFGVDTFVFFAGIDFWPNAHHRVVVPAAPHNEDLVREASMEGSPASVLKMPYVPAPGGTEQQRRAKAYRARNTAMVKHYADELQAFLHQAVFYRSGEWMTVNIAEDLNVPCVRILLP